MRSFLVTDIETITTRIVNQLAADEFAGIGPNELDYLLEEEGMCEADRCTITTATIFDLIPSHNIG